MDYDVNGPGSIRIIVYDRNGREVFNRLIADRNTGTYTEEWDGRDGQGNVLPSSFYHLKIFKDGVFIKGIKAVVIN